MSIRRVPHPEGLPMKRLIDVTCLCEHKFKVDLGVEWKPNLIIRCPKCNTIVGKTDEVVSVGWVFYGRLSES